MPAQPQAADDPETEPAKADPALENREDPADLTEVDDLETDEAHQDLEAKDVQEQVEEHEKEQAKKFGTFAGVFTPTLLTILGVIMFLRQGWVIGNAGLAGGSLIIVLAFAITGCTGLSMSCFVTNIRVGAGGAFSMISQSLGLEVGGAIGIPLYLSQALAVAMYVFGFREGWLWIFPDHPALAVDLGVFGVIVGITFVSTALAFRVQYLILAIIVVSLASVAMAAATGSMQHPVTWWGDYAGLDAAGAAGGFWVVFAVFFPASTGIMAGANMSGDLEDPRRSIPVGTMGAIVLSLGIYLILGYWLARSAPVEELTSNYTVMIDRAYWGPAVLAGLLAATFSSALASFVGAPRILQALGGHSILPAGGWMAARSAAGEPRNATLVTGVLVLGALLTRDLNAIAPVITLVFLITYATINLVVLIEQSLGLLSFRPTLRVPWFVPLLGLLGCVFVMFILNATVSLVAAAVITALYFVLMHRRLKAPFGDVRSGLFVAVAEWAAKKAKLLRGQAARAWRPNTLVPTDDARKIAGVFRLVYHLAHPVGTVKLIGVAAPGEGQAMQGRILDSQIGLQEEGVFASSCVLEAEDLPGATRTAVQALSGTFFRPNLLFLELPADPSLHEELEEVVAEASRHRMGTAIVVDHPEAGLGRRRRINLWIPDQGPDWEVRMDFENLDLAILLAYRLRDSWNARLRVLVCVEDESSRPKAERFLERLIAAARLPGEARVLVGDEDLPFFSADGPQADLDIFPLPETPDPELLWTLRERTRSSCLLTRDGGEESALA